jgi:hypothetical protein
MSSKPVLAEGISMTLIDGEGRITGYASMNRDISEGKSSTSLDGRCEVMIYSPPKSSPAGCRADPA